MQTIWRINLRTTTKYLLEGTKAESPMSLSLTWTNLKRKQASQKKTLLRDWWTMASTPLRCRGPLSEVLWLSQQSPRTKLKSTASSMLSSKSDRRLETLKKVKSIRRTTCWRTRHTLSADLCLISGTSPTLVNRLLIRLAGSCTVARFSHQLRASTQLSEIETWSVLVRTWVITLRNTKRLSTKRPERKKKNNSIKTVSWS